MLRDWWGETDETRLVEREKRGKAKPSANFCLIPMKYGVVLFFAMLLAGCSTGNVYDGVRQREAVKNAPPEPAPASQLPSRQDYEAERKKLQGAQ